MEGCWRMKRIRAGGAVVEDGPLEDPRLLRFEK